MAVRKGKSVASRLERGSTTTTTRELAEFDDDEDDWILVDGESIGDTASDQNKEENEEEKEELKREERIKCQPVDCRQSLESKQDNYTGKWSLFLGSNLRVSIKRERENTRQLRIKSQEATGRNNMALNDADVELIRASWCPARKDPVGAGVLLFRG